MSKKATTPRAAQKALLKLSPFELKDELIHLGKKAEQAQLHWNLAITWGCPFTMLLHLLQRHSISLA